MIFFAQFVMELMELNRWPLAPSLLIHVFTEMYFAFWKWCLTSSKMACYLQYKHFIISFVVTIMFCQL